LIFLAAALAGDTKYRRSLSRRYDIRPVRIPHQNRKSIRFYRRIIKHGFAWVAPGLSGRRVDGDDRRGRKNRLSKGLAYGPLFGRQSKRSAL